MCPTAARRGTLNIPPPATASDVALSAFLPLCHHLARQSERHLRPLPTPSGVSPPWKDQYVFSAIPSVRSVVSSLLTAGSLHPLVLRRSLRKFLHLPPSSDSSFVAADDRPFANDAAAMLGDSKMFTPGPLPLRNPASALNSRAILASHRTHCTLCTAFAAPSMLSPASAQAAPSCYIRRALLCAENGWAPQFHLPSLQPQYACVGNQQSVDAFPLSASAEIDRLYTAGKLESVPPHPPYPLYLPCPLGVVVKNSDRHWSRLVTNISIVDQASLDTANAALAPAGYKTIKARPIQNATQNGLNAASHNPSFRFPDMSAALQFVTPNCFLAKGDLSSYFNSFPFADVMRGLFNILLQGLAYISVFVFFGFAPAPFYTSGFGAELEVCLRHVHVPCTHYVDDWFTVGHPREQAVSRLYQIRDMAISWGFLWNASKEEVGQRIAFLGIVIDTVQMVLSFEALPCAAFERELNQHLDVLRGGGQLSPADINRVCGKLNWFSSVLQAGPIHTRSWYIYSVHMTRLHHHWRQRLLSDTEWWLSILHRWSSEDGATDRRNIPIVNSARLIADPRLIHCCVSDASGPDGIGYFSGEWLSDNPVYFSRQWYPGETFVSSMNGELKALAECLLRTKLRNGVMIWITDSLSAAYVVNKGSCKSWADVQLVTKIFELADELGLQLFALWTPREANTLADYLSHLATFSHRPEVGGHVQDLEEEEATGYHSLSSSPAARR